ncbi:hypothetical protein [Fervidibacter sacchari]
MMKSSVSACPRRQLNIRRPQEATLPDLSSTTDRSQWHGQF